MNKPLNSMDKDSRHLIVALEGELDAITCMAADQKFEEALAKMPDAMFVDCSNLQYISSAGIGVLIAFHHACAEKEIPVVFCGMQPKVKNVLSILGLDRLFTLEASLEKALEAAPDSNNNNS